MIIKRIILLISIFVIAICNLSAQETAIYEQPEADYRLALELFNKEKYGAAQELFLNTIKKIDDNNSEIKINATYYAAICAVELFHPDAEHYLTEFIYKHPTHPKQGIASYKMGNLHYRKRSYDDALYWYAKVDMFELSQREKEEVLFKKAYSYFMKDDIENAKQNFFEIKSPASLFYAPAQYYYAHIAYAEKNYETALLSFQRIKDDRNFGPIVPYYITHIYYKQGKYDKVIELAPPLLEESSTKRSAEISRLIGEAYFRKGNYEEAIPFLETFRQQARTSITREDNYQLGFAYYNAGEYEKAIDNLEKVTRKEDSLAQNAYYHLADAYLKTDQKRFARNAFVSAYKMDFFPQIKEDALFNYAQLSFELSYNPYNEAILAFQKYIEEYPDSHRREKAHEYLINLYMTTRNYKSALESIEETGIKTARYKKAYQRIAYYRGVELFNNGNFGGAIEHFDKSLMYNEEAELLASCLYWKAEALFRMENYDEAIETHNEFLVTPGAFSLDYYPKAHYTIGYSWFQQEDYSNALIAFRQFIRGDIDNQRFINDAYLRIADAYFMLKNYESAIDFYKRAESLGIVDTDYAIYQKALVEGVKGDFNSKIASLKKLLQQYPETSFKDNTLFELGNTYMIIDNSQEALNYYNQLISQHPNSSNTKNAKLKTALIYYNNNEDSKALQVCKSIINQYPGTKEAIEALTLMKNIYVAMDNVDEYFKYAENLPFADMSKAQQDTLTYVAAEKRYMQGDCTNAIKSFANYIDQFPNGLFSVNARFYKAECDFKMNDLQVALKGYEYVLSQPRSQFSENAALRASSINYKLNNYEAALNNFIILEEVAEQRNNLLEAKIGQMRTNFKLSRFEQAINAAQKVIMDERSPQIILQEAHLISGKSYMILNDTENAETTFEKVSKLGETEMAAEAKYNLALIEFRKGDYEKSEELIFKYINEMASYDYWLAKIFILLADNYLQTENVFQAKQTLQSIIENYDGDELNNLAKQKLKDIEEKEDQEKQETKPDTLEIEFQSGNI